MNNIKILSDTFLYSMADYDRNILGFLTGHTRIDKKSEAFEDVIYNIKKIQINPVLMKVLMSDKIVLCINNKPLPRSLKVFRASNIKDNKRDQKIIYIDCTDLIVMKGSMYKCKDLLVFMSYLIDAMTYVLYYEAPQKVIMNTDITEYSTNAFIDMVMYNVGFLSAPTTLPGNKEKMCYFIANYYLRSVMCKDNLSSVKSTSKKLSKLEQKDCDYLDIIIDQFYIKNDQNVSIDKFVLEFARIFMNQDELHKGKDKLTPEVFIHKWMYLFGPGTVFGLELFPAFSNILTDCYVGGYINQQNTIEKVVNKAISPYTTTLVLIGSENS